MTEGISMATTHAARAGRVTYEGDTATLHFERRLRHPVEAVWAALTESEHLARWLMSKATIDGRAGGSIDFLSGGAQVHATGRILVWDPPRVFEHERNIEPRPEIPTGDRSIVRWELTPIGSETLLRLTHRRLPRPVAVGVTPVTHALLDRLEDQLDGVPLADFRKRTEEVRALYLQGPGKGS